MKEKSERTILRLHPELEGLTAILADLFRNCQWKALQGRPVDAVKAYNHILGKTPCVRCRKRFDIIKDKIGRS